MPEQLEELMEDVRATAPRPREGFVQQLDERVEEGFPRQRLRPLRSTLFGPALALGACVLMAIVIGTGAIRAGGGDDDEMASGGEAAMQAEESGGSSGSGAGAAESGSDFLRAPAPGAAADATRRDAPPEVPEISAYGTKSAPTTGGSRARLVQRSAALELETGSDDFDKTTAGVLAVADGTGAIVQRSTVEERDGRGFANYDLRIPSSRLDEALRNLSRLAKVTSRTGSSDDITSSYVSADNRLDDARDQRRALLKALANADTANETDAIRARLRDARQRIAAAERDVRRVRAKADRASVSVTVKSTGRISDTAWTPGDAADDAVRVLEVAVGVTLIAAAVLAPFAILLLLGLIGGKVVRKRRREAALG